MRDDNETPDLDPIDRTMTKGCENAYLESCSFCISVAFIGLRL